LEGWLFVHNPRAKAVYQSASLQLRGNPSIKKTLIKIESISRERKSQKMQPRKGHSKQASPLRTDPPKTKGNSLRKSDSQLYSTAPTLLSHSINSTNDTYHLFLSLFPPNTPHPHTHSNHVVKPNARDHGDAPRVHQGRHSIHQPLHVCRVSVSSSPSHSCPYSSYSGLL
jgi:hypothetical protein